MNEIERIEKINDLKQSINNLYYEIIVHRSRLQNSDQQVTMKNHDINQINISIDDLNKKIVPLIKDLRRLQCKYKIEFEGELINDDGIKYWNQPETQIYYLNNCYQVDTKINTWSPYINNHYFNSLIEEVQQIIFQQLYTNFRILNISRL